MIYDKHMVSLTLNGIRTTFETELEPLTGEVDELAAFEPGEPTVIELGMTIPADNFLHLLGGPTPPIEATLRDLDGSWWWC